MEGLPEGFSVVRSNDKGSYRVGPDRDFRLVRQRPLRMRIAESAAIGFFAGLVGSFVGFFGVVAYLIIANATFEQATAALLLVTTLGVLCGAFISIWRFFSVVATQVEMAREGSRLLFGDVLRGKSELEIQDVRSVEVRALVTKQRRRMGKLESSPSELTQWTPPNGRPVLTLLTYEGREMGALTLSDVGRTLSPDKAQAVVDWLKNELDLGTGPLT